jgi:hypothetical protein
MPVGATCPKHDVELQPEGPGGTTTGAQGQPISWVTVSKFPHTLAAAAARIRLEAEGIPTFLEGERMGSPSMYRVATGGVKLQVPAEMAHDARVVLAQTWSWAGAGLEEDLDDAWEELIPEPGSMRRSVMKAIIVFLLAGPVVIWVVSLLIGHR